MTSTKAEIVIAIVGGGLGAICAAIALGRAGYAGVWPWYKTSASADVPHVVHLFEQAPEYVAQDPSRHVPQSLQVRRNRCWRRHQSKVREPGSSRRLLCIESTDIRAVRSVPCQPLPLMSRMHTRRLRTSRKKGPSFSRSWTGRMNSSSMYVLLSSQMHHVHTTETAQIRGKGGPNSYVHRCGSTLASEQQN
jgi:hypothetical protein